MNTLGFVQARLPEQIGISGIGAVIHLARLNHFHRAEFFSAFGLRSQRTEDLSWVLATSEKRKAALQAAIQLSSTHRSHWNIEYWLPFRAPELWSSVAWRFRACPCCLSHGYHSLLFQLPWLACCPWHKTALIASCRRCQKPLAESMATNQDFMRCQCGADPVDEQKILAGEQSIEAERSRFLKAYLYWAAETRLHDRLHCPEEFDHGGSEALAGLVTPPAALRRWSGAFQQPSPSGVHVSRLASRHRAAYRALDKGMQRCLESLSQREAGMVVLPEELAPSLADIPIRMTRQLLPGSLTSEEARVFGLVAKATERSMDRARRDLLLLPAQKVGKHLYLDVRLLHRSTYGAIRRIAAALIESDIEDRHLSMLMGALRLLLLRGYAEGFAYVVGRHLPELYASPRIRYGPRTPWVLVRFARSDPAVHLAWSKRRPWAVEEEAHSAAT